MTLLGELKLKVEAVTGSTAPSELGITLPHEHVLFDLTCWLTIPEEARKKDLVESPVSITNLGELRRDPTICRDNLKNLDVDLAIKELQYYKRAGGESLVDLTSEGMGRDPLALHEISLQTGIKIMAGCGFYLDAAHPQRIKSMNTEQIAEEIVNDLTQGIGGTRIKAGIIGEIGTGWPLTPNEEKVLRAAARAHHKTEATINVHPYPYGKFSHRILDIMEEEGVELSKVVLSHIDGSLDTEYHKSLAKRGAYIEYDSFGSEVYMDSIGQRDFSDAERVECVVEMIKSGYISQLLLSHDVSWKIHLKQYGGYGYDHLLTHIEPMLRRKGISQDQIDIMMIENPGKILTI